MDESRNPKDLDDQHEPAPTARAIFHTSREVPCPYLPNKLERQVYIELKGSGSPTILDHLNRFGFRRSHHLAYRPICRDCNVCVSARMRVHDMNLSKSLRRCMNRNRDLTITSVGLNPTEEQFELFGRYLELRHPGGGMTQMTRSDFDALVLASSVESHFLEFRDADEKLVAGVLYDRFSDGFSAVYSFFDPDRSSDGVGNYIILYLAYMTRDAGLPYLYLGHFVEGSPKMEYKSKFRPLEAFVDGDWKVLFA